MTDIMLPADPKESRQRALFDEHLRYLGAYRASVDSTGQAVEVRSVRPDFTYAVPERGAELEPLLGVFRTVHVAPWGHNHLETISARGLKYRGSLSYMELKHDASTWRDRTGLAITEVHDESELDVFSEVWHLTLLEPPTAAASLGTTLRIAAVKLTNVNGFPAALRPWRTWLAAANRRNLNRAGHRFYLAHYRGRAAGVVLAVYGTRIVALHSLATRREFQRRGIGTALMKRAIEDAYREGRDEVTLQVDGGSAAEAFYRGLGFDVAFGVEIYSC